MLQWFCTIFFLLTLSIYNVHAADGVEKVDDYSLRLTVIVSKEIIVDYDYTFLLQQRQTILDQKAREIIQRDAELDKINMLIDQARTLGLKEKRAEALEPARSKQ